MSTTSTTTLPPPAEAMTAREISQEAAREMLAALKGLLLAATEVGELPEYGQVTVARKAVARAEGRA